MQYQRVIPRDFFNEAKLLKCMGLLSFKVLDEMMPAGIKIAIDESGESFNIEMTDNGELTVTNVRVTINDNEVICCNVYNSKDNYPLYCYHGENYEECTLIFNEMGAFCEDFINTFSILKN